jgi:hypothetical protein
MRVDVQVRPNQIWSHAGNDGQWRRVRVMNVLANAVELKYENAPGLLDVEKTFSTTMDAMKNAGRYRLLSE